MLREGCFRCLILFLKVATRYLGLILAVKDADFERGDFAFAISNLHTSSFQVFEILKDGLIGVDEVGYFLRCLSPRDEFLNQQS